MMMRNTVLAMLTVLTLVAFGACNQGDNSGGDSNTTTTSSTSGSSTGETSTPVKVGMGKAPALSYTTFDGATAALGDHLGKPVVLNFWAAWCPPCKNEMPEFEAMYKKYDGQFELIAIAVDERNDPQAFFTTKGFSYTGARSADVMKYVEMSIPVTAFIDKQGNLIHKETGGMSADAFEKYLKQIL